MITKTILVVTISLVLLHSGSAFFRPRPQLIEMHEDSENNGFLSGLKKLFGFLDSKPKEIEVTKEEEIGPEEFRRRKLQCAIWAKYYHIGWMEAFCLKALKNEYPKFPNIQSRFF